MKRRRSDRAGARPRRNRRFEILERRGVRRSIIAGAIFIVVVCAFTVYAVAIEPSRLVTRASTVQPNNWPPKLDGMRVALISDLHAGSLHVRGEKLAQVVSAVRDAEPDLVLVLGDNVIDGNDLGGKYVPPDAVAAGLRGLRAPLGVFAVLGNHDWTADGLGMWRAFEQNGIRVLQNDVARLRWKGTRFTVAGIADAWTSGPDVTGALSRVPAGEPVIAMTHNPNTFTQIPPRVSLTVAGHTHGGQINLPLIGRPIVPTDGRHYPEGGYRDHGRVFFVTIGVGTSSIPARFRETPEVAVLTLRANEH